MPDSPQEIADELRKIANEIESGEIFDVDLNVVTSEEELGGQDEEMQISFKYRD